MTSKLDSESSFSNDSTKKILGFEYQKLVAIEYCLNSKPEDIVYIECYGDIAIGNEIIETKKHEENYIMNEQSPDFWKTLKNFVKEKKITNQYSRLILHTTAKVKDNSIFSNWNDKDCYEKFRLLERIKNKPNDSIKVFSEFVFYFNKSYQKSDLLEILDKFEIRFSQPNIVEKCHDIMDHPIFLTLEQKYHNDMLIYLIGYITKRAIDDSNKWRIICNDFFQDLSSQLKKFLNYKVPFPEVSMDNSLKANKNFTFVKKLEEIELEEEVEEAVINYFRSEISSLKLIEWGGSSISNEINLFEIELHNKMSDTKKFYSLDLPVLGASKSELLRYSKKFFYKCKTFEKLCVRDVQDIEMYFQHGKMHKIVEEKGFNWILEGGLF